MPTEINTGQAGLAQSASQNQGVNRSNANDSRNSPKVSDPKSGNTISDAASQAEGTPSQNAGESSVVISESGQKLQSLEQSIRQEPQVRVEVVREIQKRVENGDFPIDVENLAKQIIDQESQL